LTTISVISSSSAVGTSSMSALLAISDVVIYPESLVISLVLVGISISDIASEIAVSVSVLV
jgi:hypothetical protein